MKSSMICTANPIFFGW